MGGGGSPGGVGRSPAGPRIGDGGTTNPGGGLVTGRRGVVFPDWSLNGREPDRGVKEGRCS